MFWALELDICFCFCPLRRGYYTEKFFCCIYVEILIQNAGVRSLLIRWCFCRVNIKLISVWQIYNNIKDFFRYSKCFILWVVLVLTFLESSWLMYVLFA